MSKSKAELVVMPPGKPRTEEAILIGRHLLLMVDHLFILMK
jgi:hypothetical protein